MKIVPVLVARIYLTESSHLLEKIIEYLKRKAEIRGISVFRAISGYGENGTLTSSLVDLSLNLPLVIEFFDDKAKVEKALSNLGTIVKPEHIVLWEAHTNI